MYYKHPILNLPQLLWYCAKFSITWIHPPLPPLAILNHVLLHARKKHSELTFHPGESLPCMVLDMDGCVVLYDLIFNNTPMLVTGLSQVI